MGLQLGVLEGRNRHVLKDLYGAELLEMYEGSALSIAPPGGESASLPFSPLSLTLV
jgi:hypothetical protein